MASSDHGLARRNSDVFWAADDADKVQSEALDRINSYYQDVKASGRGVIWRRAYLAYYGLELIAGVGGTHASSSIGRGGEQGELLLMKVNELRNILSHILNIICRDAPVYEAQAHDTSSEAEAACSLAEDLIAQLGREQDIDGKNRRGVEWSLVMGEGYLGAKWDPSIGPWGQPEVDSSSGDFKRDENGAPIKKRQGDVKLDVYGPHDVIHDVRKPGWEPGWVIVRDWVNRHDLIARYGKPPPPPQPPGEPQLPPEPPPPQAGNPQMAQAYQQAVQAHQQLVQKKQQEHAQATTMYQEQVAMYPKAAMQAELFSTAILACTTRDEVDQATLPFWTFGQHMPSDEIALYTLYVAKTDALPGGRIVHFVDNPTNGVLLQGPLPYDEIPVERIAAGDWLDRGYTYSVAFDLLGMQEAIDAFWTLFVTIADLAGVPNILVPDMSNIGVDELPGGGREMRYKPNGDLPNGGAPTIMVIPDVPKVIMEGVNMAPAVMERLSGVNSVVRGDPAENIKAGNYAALVQVQSAEFFTPAKRNDVRALERIMGVHALGMYATFAKAERVVAIEGDARGKRTLSFTRDSLAPVAKVIATISNPMRETTAGRLMLADKLLAMVDPQTGKRAIDESQWMEVLDTGRWEPATDPTKAPADVIKRENELLNEGCETEQQCAQDVPVLPWDNDEEHVKGHVAEATTNMETRKDPKKIQTFAWHIAAHEKNMAAKLTGQGVPPSGMDPHQPPGPPPGAPGGPPGGAAPPNGKPGAGGPAPVGPGADAGVGLPHVAKPPPGTGQPS